MGYTNAALARLAAEVRLELGLADSVPFDPHLWAREYGVPFLSLDEIGAGPASVSRFTIERPELWSAALVKSGSGHFVVYNTAHADVRVRSNLAHEIAHLVAEHSLNSGWMTDDKCAGSGASQEKEAAELAGALLVPKEKAKLHAIRGGDPAALALAYNVSFEMAQWRMRASGGAVIAQRSKSKWASHA